jgi:Cof subfamily protein (haloacid dehalogenase superfamily)
LSKTEFRLIAMDLDGTLLRSDYSVSQRTIEAIHACHRAGYKIVLCTGRRWRKSIPTIQALSIPVFCAVNNGVIMRRSDTSEIIFKEFFPSDLYSVMLRELKGMNLIPIVHVFQEDIDFIIEKNVSKDDFFLPSYIEKNSAFYERVENLFDYKSENIVQFCIMEEFEFLEPIEKKLKKLYGSRLNFHIVRNVQYAGCILEIMSNRASKFRATKFLMDSLGIKKEQMIAFGDDMNDIELLESAGCSVAMENALPEVKQVAKMITLSNDEDGIAVILEKLLSN